MIGLWMRLTGRGVPVARWGRAEIARRRSVLLFWSIPFFLVVVLVAGKLFSMMAIAGAAQDRFADGDFEGSASSARELFVANVVERYRAPFNLGTAFLGLGLYDDAQAQLNDALDIAPPHESCAIRTNLSLAYEGEGDELQAAGEYADAYFLFQRAETVLMLADPSCFEAPPSGDDPFEPPPSGSFEDVSNEAERRLVDKRNAAVEAFNEQNTAEPEDSGSGDDGGQPDVDERLDELGEQLGEAQGERTESTDDNRGSNGGGSSSTRPW